MSAHLYTELFRLGSAATDAGVLDWLRALLIGHGLHHIHHLVGGALHLPHWLVK
jgi:hypothetical protein